MVSTSLLATQTTTLCGRRAFHRAMIDAGVALGVGEANPVLPGGQGRLRPQRPPHLLIAWIALQVALRIASYGSTSPGSGSQR